MVVVIKTTKQRPKTQQVTSVGENVEKLKYNVKWFPWKAGWLFLEKLNVELLDDTTIRLSLHSEELKGGALKQMSVPLFRAALFTIVKR